MMYHGGFDNVPKDFEKKLTKNQAKWLVIFIIAILLLIIIFA